MSEPPTERSDDTAGEFARDLAEGSGERQRLDLGVALVVDLVGGCDHAGITVIKTKPTRMVTVAASSKIAEACDQMQYDLDQGPCVDTVRTHQTVVSAAVGSDPRWPSWGPAVAKKYNIGSMLSLLLYTHADSYGALNLYSERPEAYTDEDLLIAQSLAPHLAVALVGGREHDQLGLAIVNRTLIGQAEGILIERHRVTAEQAFEMLRQRSQDANRRLVAIADDLVRTGQWEGPTRAADPFGRATSNQ